MAIFKLLKSSQKVKHTHILYVGADGTGISTVNKGHKHDLTVEPVTVDQPQVDPMTGQVVVVPVETGEMRPVITEVNGHTHEIGDVVTVESQPDAEVNNSE